MKLQRLLILCALALTSLACSGSPACSGSAGSATCTRVLFVGNSYTYVNDLPTMFATLSASGDHSVQTGMVASGGATLADHRGVRRHADGDRVGALEDRRSPGAESDSVG